MAVAIKNAIQRLAIFYEKIKCSAYNTMESYKEIWSTELFVQSTA
jgi:hypothetical protein